MYLFQSIACSGIGALCMVHYFRTGGETVIFMILGIVNLIFGSLSAKKHYENNNQN